MSSTAETLGRAVTIINDLGLHARSAATLAKTAQEAKGDVWLEFGSEQVDAKQIIDILTLGAAKGDDVMIRIEQAADTEILNRIASLFEAGFGE
jgi:phosphocarrier protein